MAEYNHDRLVKALKADGELTQKAAADKLGINIGQLSMMNFCKAKVDAGVVKKQPANAQTVKRLRDSEGHRWELIAAQIGKGVSEVKELYGGADKAKSSYTGKGRNFNGSTAGAGRTTSSSKSKSKTKAATAGRSSSKKTAAAQPGRSSGRSSSKSKTAPATRTSGRTSARRTTAANPS